MATRERVERLKEEKKHFKSTLRRKLSEILKGARAVDKSKKGKRTIIVNNINQKSLDSFALHRERKNREMKKKKKEKQERVASYEIKTRHTDS